MTVVEQNRAEAGRQRVAHHANLDRLSVARSASQPVSRSVSQQANAGAIFHTPAHEEQSCCSSAETVCNN